MKDVSELQSVAQRKNQQIDWEYGMASLKIEKENAVLLQVCQWNEPRRAGYEKNTDK